MTEKQETPRDLVVTQPDSRSLAERGTTSLITRGAELAAQLRGDVDARALSLVQTTIVTLPGGMTLEMVLIPAGSFTMGSNEETTEQPVHTVTIARPFLMGKYPVTQAQWRTVMGANPSHFTGNLNRPVESVSWKDCQEFIRRLNTLANGGGFRLPSEAEREYACRAGSSTRWYFGNDETQLANHAWYNTNSAGTTHPVGQKLPNAFGLYDMSGNTWEWCQDFWHDNYDGAPMDGSAWENPTGSNSYRVLRGGACYGTSTFCRSACRNYNFPDSRYGGFGVRLVRTP